ncbi:MAG: pyruvate dehydrogenase (acetyl-transferring) E1 component subunit alpha [Gammaproteobacteria bacterium]|nr:pyruvate dehydrogenase (acetyl-transferring) E1 component subunit alpha [Gammaproteobacteria bacterium]
MNTPATIRASQADVNLRLTAEEKIGLLRQMLRIRRFELAALKHYQAGIHMGGFLHLCTGQESVAVATVSLCGENDHIVAGYRTHGQALAVGMTMNECMAELFGKATGCSKGKGGSMHFFAPDKNYWGGHGIVAGQTPLGLGLAFALKYRSAKGCCLCFLGDGAINQGVYHESLNMAALWNLPVVYIIENNHYSMGTSIERSSAFKECLAARAEAYGIDWDRFSGEDIYEVRARTWAAMERARNELRPTVLQIDTYRYYGHSVADANAKKYRSPKEIEEYRRQHDPLMLWQRRLSEEGVVNDEQVEAFDAEAKTEAAEAVRFAETSPLPEPEDIFRDVYYEVDRQTQAGRAGTFFFND